MRPILSEVGRRKSRSALVYGIVTLILTVVAIGSSGLDWELSLGITVAWIIQATAFWRLDCALSSGRNAMRAWLGGMGARFGGLVFVGGLTLVGATSADVPIAYGISMLLLLLAEAGWLVRRLKND